MSEPIDPFHQLLIEFEEQGRWEDLLGNVLAVLNGDGGHYQVEHGGGRAAIRGLRRHYRLYEQADALAEALGGLLSSVRNQPWDVGTWCGKADAALRAYKEETP